MNTLTKPPSPTGSEPREDDPTGVRALLSSLPEPDPMPDHLVERINASLAAEQAQRAARMSDGPVTPLRVTARRRPRLLYAMAGAAAAVALVAAVGNNLLTASQSTTSSTSAAIADTARASSSSDAEAGRGALPSAQDKAPAAAGGAATVSLVQMSLSGARYTRADFVTQAKTLRDSAFAAVDPQPGESASRGLAGTDLGLRRCLSAIGAAGAQMVRADVAFYEGAPAVIIVATTNGIPVAYAVGRQCSPADTAVLRTATPLS